MLPRGLPGLEWQFRKDSSSKAGPWSFLFSCFMAWPEGIIALIRCNVLPTNFCVFNSTCRGQAVWVRRPAFSILPGTPCGLRKADAPPSPPMVHTIISSSLSGSFQELEDGPVWHYGHKLPGQREELAATSSSLRLSSPLHLLCPRPQHPQQVRATNCPWPCSGRDASTPLVILPKSQVGI